MTKTTSKALSRASSAVENSNGADVIDISSILGIFWRGKWLTLLCMIVAILAGGYYAYKVATPIYRTTSVVVLQNSQSPVMDLDSVFSGLTFDDSAINTEIQVLRSRTLMEKVMDRLNLIEDPEFNASLSAPGIVTVLKNKVKDILGLGSTGVVDAETRAQRIRQNTVTALLDHTDVRNMPNSLVLQISAVTEKARKSARIADVIAEEYILGQMQVKFEELETTTAWLSERVASLRTELEVAESRVSAFSVGAELINPETLAGLERQLKETRDRLEITQGAFKVANDRLAALQAAGTAQEKLSVADDAQLRQALTRIDQPDGQRMFDTLFAQIVSRAMVDVQRLNAQVDALGLSRDTLTAQLNRQSADLIQLQQLSREAEASRLLYEYFLSRLKETSAQQGIQQADGRILSTAVIPEFAFSPRRSVILVMSALAGFVLGSALALFFELRKSTFRTAHEIEQATGTAVIGQIPLLPLRKRADALTYIIDKPRSAAAEAVRNLRTSILLANKDAPPQIIAISSALPGEGKTTVSLAIAHNFSGVSNRVLLIEGDIRRRVFSEYFNIEKDKGLLSVMAKESRIEDVVIHDEKTGVDILVGENSKKNPVDVFTSAEFVEFLKDMRTKYDRIIIDTPPVLLVPDARVIAQHADAMVLAVHWDSTLQSQVKEALHMFESVNVNVSGIALNQISMKGMKRYGYGQTYGASTMYGSSYYVN